MSGTPTRDFAVILAELYALTNKMAEQRHDSDFLVEAVARRQLLMDEYDALAKADPNSKAIFEKDQANRDTVNKMIAMDQLVSKALEDHWKAGRQDVASANAQQNAQQRVLDYLGRLHTPGNRMNTQL